MFCRSSPFLDEDSERCPPSVDDLTDSPIVQVGDVNLDRLPVVGLLKGPVRNAQCLDAKLLGHRWELDVNLDGDHDLSS
jgi:hypothetical protein